MGAGLLIDTSNWPSEKCLALLRQTELFRAFQFPALRAVLTASRLVSLKTSQPLFAGRSQALSGFLLAEGVLRYDAAGDAEEPTYLAPPAIIGETALVTGCLRPPITVTAEVDSILLEIPRATFMRVIAEHPKSAAQTQRLISGHLRNLVRDLDAVRLRLDAIAAADHSPREGAS
ncbi:MAG: cyclic nucleotide-binding domain-containing protein [Bradyrhizobium sp.]|nr:MAG: cyclic nucleotide-binding domain-containing protein [Bradyrhizobium sp.]